MELDNKRLSEILFFISEHIAKEDREFNLDLSVMIRGWLREEGLSDELRKNIQEWGFTFNGK